MNSLKIDGEFVSVFDICQAYAQLESDYNVDGILWERPSNRRRRESIGVQLLRIAYHDPYRWVEIAEEREDGDDPGDDDVRNIYMQNVLKWGLPIDADLMRAMKRFYTPWFLAKFPQTKGDTYAARL